MPDLRATYRLQLTPEFGFREARDVVPYLRGLGVSHLYLSPSLQARRGSTHGYDVVDPTRISDELGGEDEFRDIVPNHMATSEEENRYWREPELRQKFFDVDPQTGWHRRFFDIGDTNEFEWLRRLYDRDDLEEAAASLHVYRTYVEPWSGKVDEQDRDAVAAVPDDLRRVLLLEQRGNDEFVTRWQQTTGPVMAKGIEDTAFYRYLRLTALNEVGGDPGRFSLPVEQFHRANLERAERFPMHLLASQTHDTKRSGDVRARIGVLSELADEWGERVRGWRVLDDPGEDYLLWQTLVGAWPIERGRVEAYMQKALREAKRNTSWIEPSETHERRVREAIARVYERLPDGFEELAARVAERGREVSLDQTLLKLTCPGVPDIYQGDEHETLSLVDPDNRRPVDWTRRDSPKSDLIRRVLAVRADYPDAFAGSYEPLELGPETCGFVRGGRIRVVVPLRRNGLPQELSVVA